MTVNYIYQWCLKLIKKNQSGSLKSTDFNIHWSNSSRTYQGDLIGRFQPRAIGKIGGNSGLVEDEIILLKLAPFIKPVTGMSVISGQVNKPTDFIYKMAIRANGYPVYEVNHDQWWSLSQDVIDPPSIADNRYYYTEYQNYYLVSPSATPTIDLDYIASPVDVFWNFTFDSQNRQIYNPTGSVDPQWDDNSCMEITSRMLTTLGISFDKKEFVGFGKSVQKEGE